MAMARSAAASCGSLFSQTGDAFIGGGVPERNRGDAKTTAADVNSWHAPFCFTVVLTLFPFKFPEFPSFTITHLHFLSPYFRCILHCMPSNSLKLVEIRGTLFLCPVTS